MHHLLIVLEAGMICVFSPQPSEFAKSIVIVYLAVALDKMEERL